MSDYYAEMQADRQAIAELKGGIEWAKHKLQAIDRITPAPEEIQQATRPAKRTPQENRALFEKWGFDVKNPQHRQAWRARPKTRF